MLFIDKTQRTVLIGLTKWNFYYENWSILPIRTQTRCLL